MTPSQIIALVRDALILAALAFVVWWIWRSGEDRVKVADMAAVQKQIAANSKALADWQTADTQAKEKRDATIQALSDRIDRQPPIVVRVTPPKASPSAVPGVQASGSVSGPSDTGEAGSGHRGSSTEDLRPAFNQVEKEAAKALAECWKIIATCKVPK